MKVIRNINNNVAVCVDSNNHEVVAFGKGIGFQTPPYEIELSKIDRTYYNLDAHYVDLLYELPENVMEVTNEIIEKGKIYLGANELSQFFWFSLCDHINFAIQNVKRGIVLSSPLTNEIRHLYEKEMRLGEWSVKWIEKRLFVKLPTSEAGNIALHFINAQMQTEETRKKEKMEIFVEDITDIVEHELNIIIDRKEFNYSRFVTHLKLLLKRSNQLNESSSENIRMYKEVYGMLPNLRTSIEKIKEYIANELGIELNEEELLYLMMHLNRLCVRDGL